MDSNELNVPAVLVSVGRRLDHLEPGDQLLIVDGIVTSVRKQSGVDGGCAALAASLRPTRPPPKLPAEPGEAPPRRPRRPLAGAALPSVERLRAADAMLELMRERGGTIRATELPKSLGEAAGKPWHLRGAISDLVEAGKVTIGGKQVKGRIYHLVDGAD